MRIPKDILTNSSKAPEVYLCQVDKSIIGGLRNVINFNYHGKFNAYSEISMEVDRIYIDPVTGNYMVNPLYDYIEGLRIIYVVDFGYFEIQEASIVSDGVREYKDVVAYSLEYQLGQKYLEDFVINQGTVESIDGVKLLNQADPSHSLLHLVLEKARNWSVGHVDLSIQDRQRSFDIDSDTTIYDFIQNNMADAFGIVVIYDTYDNTVNVYDEETYSLDSNVFVSKDNLAQEIHVDYSADDIKTLLNVYGADDLSIREVNLGLPYIMNLDYYNTKEWLGEDLYSAYNSYCKLATSYQKEYSELILEWSTLYDEWSELYNKVPDYDNEDYDGSIPTVYSRSDLPTPSSQNVLQVWRVVEGDSTWYYICKADNSSGTTTYRWVLDVDNISSFYTFPVPSVEYADLVVKVYNKESTSGVLYYVCKVVESPSQSNNWTTKYGWVLADDSYGINLLKEKEKCYLDIQEVHVSAGYAEKTNENYQRYLDNYNKLIAIQNQLKEETAKAQVVQEKLDAVMDKMNVITTALQLENNFNESQRKLLSAFIREDTLTDDHYLVTELDDDKAAMKVKQELMEAGQKELKKISQPQLSFSMGLANLLAMPEFEPIVNEFNVGSTVTVEIRPDYVVKTQILEVQINFDDMSDFNVTFGNLTSLTSQIDIHAALMSQAVSAGKSVAQSGSYWKKGADTANSINSRIERGLIDALTSIKSTENQAISWDSHGLHLRKYANEEKTEYMDEQIWANNEKLVFTDDNWRSAKMAIGKFNDSELGEVYGIIAPNVVGTLLAGKNLVIDSEKTDGTISSFRVDENGARLYNSTFLMQKEVTNDDGTTSNGQILIDPKYGIVAGADIYTTASDGTIIPVFDEHQQGVVNKEDGMPIKSNFFLDINNGNAYFRGTVYADGGYFTGNLSGANITGAIGTFSGTLEAGDGLIGGWTIKEGCLYSGSGNKTVGLSSKYDINDKSTDYAIWAGAEDPANAPFYVKRDGSIYATSGTFKGKLDAATGSFAGDISAATGTFKSQINVNNKFIVDDKGNVTITGGSISWGAINGSSNISQSITNAQTTANNAYALASSVQLPGYLETTYINQASIYAPQIIGQTIDLGYGYLQNGQLQTISRGSIELAATSTGVGVSLNSKSGLKIVATNNVWLSGYGGPEIILGYPDGISFPVCKINGGPLVVPAHNFGPLYGRPTQATYGQLYFATS